ncbi:MAG: SurA N-terminal domain-containing protein [Gammaproteobacteria bacterium]|nr:SurA N-terminal domain-containing protein [Gammaproteobacteria bacterium]
MLLKIREKATGWIAYTIVTLIAIPFALWGIQQYFGWSDAPTALSIGDVEISSAQIARNFAQRKRDIEAESQGAAMPPDNAILSQVISDRLGQELLTQAADRYRYEVADSTLAKMIAELPQFQSDGRFDPRQYTLFLQSQRIPKTAFENNYRRQLKRSQFLEVVRESSFVLKSEREQYEKLFSQERKVRYVTVASDNFLEPGGVGDEEAQAYYEQNREQYRSPLQVRFRYIEIQVDDLVSGEAVGDEEVREYYETRADEFATPEKRRVRYILVSGEQRDEGGMAARLREITGRIAEGADFAELAKEYSDDTLTAESGGELPPMSEDEVTDEAVRAAVFGLAEGEVSEPVEGEFGYQIFQLAEITPREEKTFDEVREELEESLKYERAEQQYAGLVTDINRISYEQGELFFRIMARAYPGIPVEVTPWLDADKEEGLLAWPRARQVALTRLLAGEELNSGLVEVDRGHALFFSVAERQPSTQLAFDAVREDVVATLVARRAAETARKRHQEWLNQLRTGGKTLDQLAGDGVFEIVDAGYINRYDSELPADVVKTAFVTDAPVAGPPVYVAAQDGGEPVIVELSAVREGDELEPESLSFAGRETQAVLESLRDVFEVRLHPDELQKLTESL